MLRRDRPLQSVRTSSDRPARLHALRAHGNQARTEAVPARMGACALDSFERVFDDGCVSSSRSLAALDPRRSVVEQLRERVAALEQKPAGQPIPALPGLGDVVALHAGATYAVDSSSLALALAAGASRAGEWVGFAGCADFGAEAAAELGFELSRTVLVPDPGEHWLEVTAALVDVLRVVVLRPPASVDERTAGILDARLRQALLRAGGPGRLAARRGSAERRGVGWSGPDARARGSCRSGVPASSSTGGRGPRGAPS